MFITVFRIQKFEFLTQQLFSVKVRIRIVTMNLRMEALFTVLEVRILVSIDPLFLNSTSLPNQLNTMFTYTDMYVHTYTYTCTYMYYIL